MRRIILASLAALVLVSVGAAAQDYFSPFGAYVDIPLAGPDPCNGSGAPLQVSPVVYDSTLILFYRCADGRSVLRRYFRPNDRNTPPVAPLACVTGAPGPGWVCQDGGWLPPNSPLLKR